MVHFNERPRGKAESGDRTILGLDVGSTTTKGVIMRLQRQGYSGRGLSPHGWGSGRLHPERSIAASRIKLTSR